MTNFFSVTDLVRTQVEPYLHLSWFLYEAMEREHRLNLQAIAATPGSLVHAWSRMVSSGMTSVHARQLDYLRT